jgi:hypothetical protein
MITRITLSLRTTVFGPGGFDPAAVAEKHPPAAKARGRRSPLVFARRRARASDTVTLDAGAHAMDTHWATDVDVRGQSQAAIARGAEADAEALRVGGELEQPASAAGTSATGGTPGSSSSSRAPPPKDHRRWAPVASTSASATVFDPEEMEWRQNRSGEDMGVAV